MKNKKSISLFSALLILFFHLWISLSGSAVENFLKQISYVGVDIFFFLSGYSLAGRPINNYFKFVSSRFWAIYFKYILFAVFSCFYLKWAMPRVFLVICGQELFAKGGGAFLWFLPAIMIVYVLFPLFRKMDEKKPVVAGVVVGALLLGLGIIFTYALRYHQIFIFINRLPIVFIAYYFSKYKVIDKLLNQLWKSICFGILLVLAGGYLAYLFAYKSKLQFPFADMFYITLIPLVIGLVILISLLPEVRLVKWIGSSTLEIYALQMICGYKLANNLLKSTRNVLVTNLLVMVIIISGATVLHYLYEICYKRINNAVLRKTDR